MQKGQIDRCYTLLGISPSASISEIKKAFRTKAKHLHPDRNPSPQAHAEFLELNEAFAFLIELKSKQKDQLLDRQSEKNDETDYETWERITRDKVRQRAKQQAKMSYQEYMRSENFRMYSSIEIVFTHFIFLMSLCTLLILPPVLIYAYGPKGIVMSVVFNLLMLLFTMSAIRNIHKLNFKEFLEAFSYLIQTEIAISFAMILLNITVFYFIGLNTLIKLSSLIGSYFIGAGLVILLLWISAKFRAKKLNSYHTYLGSMCIMPGVISLFLLTNYFFSASPTVETFNYTAIRSSTNGGYLTGLIDLEDNAYNDFSTIRSFSDRSSMQHYGQIRYTFAKGLWGIKVMKDHQFVKADKINIQSYGSCLEMIDDKEHYTDYYNCIQENNQTFPSHGVVSAILYSNTSENFGHFSKDAGKRISTKKINELKTIIGDSSNFRWGELTTTHPDKYIAFTNMKGEIINEMSISYDGMISTNPRLGTIKWGALSDKGYRKLLQWVEKIAN